MNKPVDLRVIKTKRAIRNAFIKLLAEKDISEITITDIADAAEINRKTFYNYYRGIYQILDELENEIISAFDAALNDVDFNQIMKNPYCIFSKLTDIINSDFELYDALSKHNNDSGLTFKIISILKGKIQKSLATQMAVDEQDRTLILDYTVSGMLTVYINWFHSDRRRSIGELSDRISMLCFSGVNGVLKCNAK